jgi:hypothetical protein
LPYFAVLAAWLRRSPSALILYDFYPEVLVAGGVQAETALSVKTIRLLNRLMYRALSAIVVIGRGVAQHVSPYGGATPSKIVYIPNWATLTPGYRASIPDNRLRPHDLSRRDLPSGPPFCNYSLKVPDE